MFLFVDFSCFFFFLASFRCLLSTYLLIVIKCYTVTLPHTPLFTTLNHRNCFGLTHGFFLFKLSTSSYCLLDYTILSSVLQNVTWPSSLALFTNIVLLSFPCVPRVRGRARLFAFLFRTRVVSQGYRRDHKLFSLTRLLFQNNN